MIEPRWAIVHRSLTIPALPPVYWTGEQDWSGTAEVFTHHIDRAARFPSAEVAAQTFRGAYRPTATCCNPEEL